MYDKARFFGGTAYLGIPVNQEFRTLVLQGMERFGNNFGASRNNNIVPSIYRHAEEEAAGRCGSEAAIILSSGYLAAQLVVRNFSGSHAAYYAPGAHPALWVGASPQVREKSFDEWSKSIVSSSRNFSGPALLVTNSVDNIHPQVYDFKWIENLNSKHEIIVVVDDSHGLGVLGPQGGGVYPMLPQKKGIRIIVVSSMAKALGVDAGLILSNSSTIAALRKTPVYAGASPPSPGMVYAYLNASEIYRQERSKLLANIRTFSGVAPRFEFSDGFPVYLIRERSLSERIIKADYQISSFAYPDPDSDPVDRIIISSLHDRESLLTLAALISG